MKYASSIRYAGDLVDAAECDYQDYDYLKLLCPECKDPVFLRGASNRVVNGKTVNVGACFCHFPGKDPSLIAQCENRVSRYTPQELQRSAANARNQRLKLLQRNFIQIMSQNSYAPIIADCRREVIKHLGISLERFLEPDFRALMPRLNFERIKSRLPSFIDEFFATIGGEYGDWLRKDKPRLLNQFESRMHKSICLEVLDFLAAKSSIPLREHVLTLALIDWHWTKTNGAALYTSNVEIEQQLLHFMIVIITTPWAEEFAKLQKNPITKGTGFAKTLIHQ